MVSREVVRRRLIDLAVVPVAHEEDEEAVPGLAHGVRELGEAAHPREHLSASIAKWTELRPGSQVLGACARDLCPFRLSDPF